MNRCRRPVGKIVEIDGWPCRPAITRASAAAVGQSAPSPSTSDRAKSEPIGVALVIGPPQARGGCAARRSATV